MFLRSYYTRQRSRHNNGVTNEVISEDIFDIVHHSLVAATVVNRPVGYTM